MKKFEQVKLNRMIKTQYDETTIDCWNCKKSVINERFEAHAKECLTLKCMSSECTLKFESIEKLETHIFRDCPHTEVVFTDKCIRREFQSHKTLTKEVNRLT